jgi:hypothetical protein
MSGFHRFLLPIAVLLALMILPACSSDDDSNPTGTPGAGDPPEADISAVTDVALPLGLTSSPDAMAQQVVHYLGHLDWMQMRMDRLQPPADKAPEKAGPWVYTWSEGEPGYDELAMTLTITELLDYHTWVLKGSGLRWEVVYDDYVFLNASIAKDGSHGFLEEYDAQGSGDLAMRWAWEVVGDGDIEYAVDVWDPFTPYLVLPVLNADGSGSMRVYNGVPGEGWLYLEVAWDATGAGTWTEYDDGGGVVDSGSWTASTR